MIVDWGTVPAWAAVVVAGTGVVLALRQLTLAAGAQHDQVQIARANLLLSIDKTFESEEIYRSRKAVRSLRNRAEGAVEANNHKDRSPNAKMEAVAVEVSHYLDTLWEQAKAISDEDIEKSDSKSRKAIDQYTEIMALPFWMETIGMLCRRGLLPKDDVLDIYDAVIISTIQNFQRHFDVRRTQGLPQNGRFMENAYWLLDEATAYKRKRDEPMPTRPAKSRTKWFA